jgi:hypothetical protein
VVKARHGDFKSINTNLTHMEIKVARYFTKFRFSARPLTIFQSTPITLQKGRIFTNVAVRTTGLANVTFVSLFAINYGKPYNKVYVKNGDQIITYYFYGPDLSFDIATTIRHGSPGFISRRCKRFFSSMNGPDRLESSQTHFQSVQRD